MHRCKPVQLLLFYNYFNKIIAIIKFIRFDDFSATGKISVKICEISVKSFYDENIEYFLSNTF